MCLSDVHLIDGTLTPLLLRGDTVTLGHEVSGTVAGVGAGVTAWSPGQRVVLHAGEVRDGVTYTRGADYDGGWAEYALSAAGALTLLPDAIPFDQGAITPDAVSTPWGATTESGAVRPAEAVGVWGVGGLGPDPPDRPGVHAVQLLRAIGACPVVAVAPSPVGPRSRPGRRCRPRRGLRRPGPAQGRPSGDRRGGPGRRLRLRGRAARAGAGGLRPRAQGTAGPDGSDRQAAHGHRRDPLQLPPASRSRPLRLRHAGGAAAAPAAIQGGRLDFSASVSGMLPLAEAAEAVARLETKEGDPVRLILRP